MEMRRLLYLSLLACMLGCGKIDRIPQGNMASARVPLFTLSPAFISGIDTDNTDSVYLFNGSGFGFSVDVMTDGKQYNLVGGGSCGARTVLAEGGGRSCIWECSHTFISPGDDWFAVGYDDSLWESGPGPFGSGDGCPTSWSSGDLYIRRHIDCPESPEGRMLVIEFCLTGKASVYVNGAFAGEIRGKGSLQRARIRTGKGAALRTGRNLIAIRCSSPNIRNSVADFGFALQEHSSAEKAELLDIFANSSVSVLSFRCGDEVTAELSFIAPTEFFGYSPVNYLHCRLVSDQTCKELGVAVKFNMKYVFDSLRKEENSRGFKNVILCKNTDAGLYRGTYERPAWGTMYVGALSNSADVSEDDGIISVTFPGKKAKALESSIFLGYEEDCVLQLFGENIRPLWNTSGKRTVESTVRKDVRKIRNSALKSTGSPGLRTIKANLRLGEDGCGNLILATSGFVNRMTEIRKIADTLSYYGEGRLLEGLVNPLVLYAESGRWNAPFCPPDLGAYPYAMHRISDDANYFEITSDALRIVDRIDSIAGNSDFSERHREVVDKWRKFVLKSSGKNNYD